MARLLFVDDEPVLRQLWGTVLKMNGHEPTCVGSVEEALAEIETRPYEALLCDLNIRNENDGLVVASAMRRVQPGCRNFILTGDLTADVSDEHVDGSFCKPVSICQIVDTLKNTLN